LFLGISPPLGSCFIRRFFSFSLHLKSNLLWCFHEKKLKFSKSSQTAGPKPPRPNGAHHDLHASSQSAFVPFPRSESFLKIIIIIMCSETPTQLFVVGNVSAPATSEPVIVVTFAHASS